MKSLTKNIHAGFTLIEMVVVMSIVVIMSVALFANYREIGDQGRVSAFTGKVREDLYLAQNYSLAGKTTKYGIPNGWGINFNRNTNKYIIFSDLDGDKAFSYPTKLLIHGSEATSTGAFTDSSQAANTVTVTGPPTQDTGPWPAGSFDNKYWHFDGLGDNLKVTANANFLYGSNDFAVDMQIWTDVTGGTKYILSQANVLEIYKSVGDLIYVDVYDVDGTQYQFISKNVITASSTHQIALTRKNNMLTFFLDGVVQHTERITKALSSNSSTIYLGSQSDGNYVWTGRIDEVRISKGTSRWREKFNTPTANYKQDDELVREVTMPPGLVFDSLTTAGTATSELNIFFDPTTYFMYGNGASSTEGAVIVINNAGVAGTAQAGDTPQTLTINNAGLINWTH